MKARGKTELFRIHKLYIIFPLYGRIGKYKVLTDATARLESCFSFFFNSFTVMPAKQRC